MREISREPQTNEFLIKALREAAGELIGELEGVRRRDAHRGPDGEWTFAQIAAHLQLSEQVGMSAIERILSRRSPMLEPVDLSALVEDQGERSLDLERSLYQYAQLRQELVYHLWDLAPSQWHRSAIHRYRGTVTLVQLIRELHLHDLEHLWQVRTHREALLTGAIS